MTPLVMAARTATLVGLGAVVLWSLLALFTAATGTVPPFQLAAMTFAVGGTVGLLSWLARRWVSCWVPGSGSAR